MAEQSSNAVRVTMERFPESPAVLDGASLPWGAVLQPFLPIPDARLSTRRVPRCKDCYAYFSAYSSVEYRRWRCALCGSRNRLGDGGVPSLRHPYVEYELDDDDSTKDLPQKLVYLAVLDVSSLDLAGLATDVFMATLSALPEGTWFGLVVFCHTTIGAFDLRSEQRAHLVRIPVEECSCDASFLRDAIPLEKALVQVGSIGWRGKVEAALRALRRIRAPTIQGRHKNALFVTLCAAVELIVSYASPQQVAAARILVLASVATECANVSYEELALRAGEHGVCVDVFLSENSNAIEGANDALSPLVTYTGGEMVEYVSLNECSRKLPQDLRLHLCNTNAWCALLRVRTSPEFRVAKAHGHLLAAPRFDSLWYIAGCGEKTTLTLDFEFVTPGFGNEEDCLPCFQVAIAYCCLIADGEGKIASRDLPRVQRRLRVFTAQFELASIPRDLLLSADLEAVGPVMVHRLAMLALESREEGRRTLMEWLASVLVSVEKHLSVSTGTAAPQKWKELLQPAGLALLLRIVYGLLLTPLLSISGNPTSLRWWLVQFASREPSMLLKHLCPELLAYGESNEDGEQLFCSCEALAASAGTVFLLDAGDVVHVHCRDSGGNIRETVLAIAVSRRGRTWPLPDLVTTYARTAEAQQFYRRIAGSAFTDGQEDWLSNFSRFAEAVERIVRDSG